MSFLFGGHKPNGIGTASGPFSGGSIGFNKTPPMQRGPSAQVNPTVTKLTNVQNPQFNIFAVHGLMSSTDTWTFKGPPPFTWLQNLPQLLPAQFRGVPAQVYLVGWNTNALDPANMSTSVQDTCRPLTDSLLGAIGMTPFLARKNGNPPFLPSIFIGHSMGGILSRALLSFMLSEGQGAVGLAPEGANGVDNNSTMFVPFLRQVAGVILLASPSQGSALAKIGPLAQAVSTATGGLTTQINAEHVLALMQNSPEQQQITAGFNKFCSWYAQENGRRLIVHALRETAPIAPRLLPGVLVVTPTSADVEASTKELTTTLTRDLTGLSHVQVTHFANGQDPNLAIILESFATIMSATPPPQAAAPGLGPGPAAGPAAGPSGTGGGTALLPGPSTLRRNVPGSSGSAASAVPGPSSAGSQATLDGPAPV